MSSDQKTVLVTGAGGKTGILALKKLIEQSSSFQARAFVHSTASANRVSQDSGLPHGKIHIGDVTQSSSELQQSMQGVHAVIIATSAVPKLRPTSLVGVSSLPMLCLNLAPFAHVLSLPVHIAASRCSPSWGSHTG